ncbi:MAG: DUF1385 domain-containing protein [bacterium]
MVLPPEKNKSCPARVGGQAILEGVMMRSPQRISAVVRLPSGELKTKIWESIAWHRRRKWLGLPIVRGVVALAEALVLGFRTLNWSAEVLMEAEEKPKTRKKKKWESLGMGFSIFIAVLFAIGVFMLIPYELADLLKTDKNQPLFHLVSGSARIALFLLYIWLISFMKDIHRVFQYHGAEHQAIYTFEKKRALLPENARLESRFHPRCGTSFILIVALLTIIMFVIFDMVVVSYWGHYANALVRLLVHLPFLPLVAGISYELLRLSDRFSHTAFFRLLIAPGLALQKLTTRPPDDSQREVAIAALKAALSEDVLSEPAEVNV